MYVKDVYQKAWCTSCKTVVLLIKPVVFWCCCRPGGKVVKAPFTLTNLSSSLTNFTMFKFILKSPGNGSPVMHWRYSDDGLRRRFWRTERCWCNTVRSCGYWGCFVQGNFWSTVRVSNATNVRGPCEKVQGVAPGIQGLSDVTVLSPLNTEAILSVFIRSLSRPIKESDNLVPRAFPAPPIFWGKSPGDKVG